MSLFSFLRGRKKVATSEKAMQSVDDRGWTRIFDWTPGAWQSHAPYDTQSSPLAYPTVFACTTLIQSDIAKLKIGIQRAQNGIWVDATHPAQRLLLAPNDYQNHIQFKEAWINSKLNHGNTYALKSRVGNRIEQLHVLDPLKVTPLIADNGDVFYRLNEDRLKKLEEGQLIVPNTEIIHDRFNCLYHPLVGLSPIFASGTAAITGLTTQENMKDFFANGSNPGGVLTAPGPISDPTAKRLKEYWNTEFSGKKAGNIAVAGDGLKYEPMRMNNTDAQVLELLGWDDLKICSVYHVPPYMVGVGQMPTHNNIEALTQQYYSQCLQILIESMELALDQGLGIEQGYRTQLDIDNGLFRMDSATKLDMLSKGTGAGIIAPDEARMKINLAPVPGGRYPYLQQQNYSLEALAQRDANNPFENNATPQDLSSEQMDQARSVFKSIIKIKEADAA